uniref:Uncharacterized protein n=1 Tax=Acrobeloides nanus TaxID=290746 RepID=A0A914D6F1_9BILA
MPTTSTFIPLIGWFILGMIMIISLGTLVSSVIIAIQKRGRLGERLSPKTVKLSRFFAAFSFSDIPLHLRVGTKEYIEAHQLMYQKSSLGRTPSSKSPRPVEKRSKWKSIKSSPPLNNAIGSMVMDKSTDLLMAHTLPPDDISKVSSNIEENKRKESVSSRKVDSPMVLNMTLHDDEISQGESEIMESSRPPTTRSRLPSQTGLFKQLFNGMPY